MAIPALAQTVHLSGTVLDKETQEPVPSVVIYTDDENNITLTDDKGYYNLEVHPSESVYFRQLAYDFFETTADALHANSTIYLTRNIVELSEVIVSPYYAQNIVDKAFQDLTAHLLLKKPIPYLVHIEETTTKGGAREVYALLDIALSKINKKRGTFDWNIQLARLDNIKMINESDFYTKKRNSVALELFPHRISTSPDWNNFTCEIQDINEDQFVIKVSPKHLDKNHFKYNLFTINKQDTILTEIISQSYANASELTLKKINGVDWQITNQYSRINFIQEEKSGLYYIKDYILLGNLRVLSESPYDISLKTTASARKNLPDNPVNTKKKIKPYDYFLFQSDFPNSPGFWKQ
jgi:hypothetical protein